MLRIRVIKQGAGLTNYLREEVSTAKYLDEEQAGTTVLKGKAAELLGLAGPIAIEGLEQLSRNQHPATGERITQRMKSNRRCGFLIDFLFTKEESLQKEIAPDPALDTKLLKAADKTMDAIEAFVGCRVRVAGQNDTRRTANAAYSRFVHHTSRPVQGMIDPLFHLHHKVENFTFDAEEQKWKAIEAEEIFRNAPYFQSLFHSYTQQAFREAGYELSQRGDGRFVPAHISKECVQRFSRRTAAIEEAARRRGITDPARKAELGARTREKKDVSRSLDELREEWRARLTPEERTAIEQARARAIQVRAERQRTADRTPQVERTVTPERPSDEARRAIARALNHALERDSVVTEKRLLTLAMKKMETPLSPQQLSAALEERSLIRQEVQGRTLLTTPEILREEKSMLAFARAGRGTCAPFAADANPTGIGSLGQEQYDGYREILASYDWVAILKGGAGTGRLALMKEIVQAIENRDCRVFAFAPAGDHVRGPLQEAGATETHTIAKLLADKALQKRLHGQTIWVDQAGRLGVRGMARVFDIAQKRDARVILSGDEKRHGPIERGGAFGLLARDAGIKAVELKAVERQRGDYRAALAAMADGRADSAWKRLEKLKAVTQLPQREAHQQLAKEYVTATRRGVKALAIAPGRKEREQVTQAIRRELRETGQLKGKERRVDQLRSLGWTEAERRDGANYRPGQVIRFFRPTRGFHTGDRTRVLGRDRLGLVWVKGKAGPQLLKTSRGERFDVYEKGSLTLAKGDTVRITGGGKTAIGNHILRSGSTYRVAGFVPLSGDLILNNGWVVKRSFGHLTHGYCVSSHTAQDKPVDRVFIAQSRQSFAAASRQQFHAALGAARQGARVFTDHAEGLRQRVAVPEERPAATALDEARLAARFDRHLNTIRNSHERIHEPTL